jgi:hypothetical protein
MPYFGAKHPCSAVIVQLLCNQKSDGFSDRWWNHRPKLQSIGAEQQEAVVGGLCGHNLQVGTDPAFVAIREKL